MNEVVFIARATMKRTETDGWIYFVKAPRVKLIKIGWAISPDKRLKEIASVSPIPVKMLTAYYGNFTNERMAHYRFHHLRAHGEWFRVAPELDEFIAIALKANGPAPWREADWSKALSFSQRASVEEGFRRKPVFDPKPGERGYALAQTFKRNNQ